MTVLDCPCCGEEITIERELTHGEEVSCPNCETVQIWEQDAEQAGGGRAAVSRADLTYLEVWLLGGHLEAAELARLEALGWLTPPSPLRLRGTLTLTGFWRSLQFEPAVAA